MNVLNAQTRVRPLQIDADMPDMADAACAGTDPSMWFTDKPQRPLDMEPRTRWVEPKPVRTMRLRRMRQALAICRDCPALAACGDYTQQHPEMTAYGIWAGTTGDQRRKARGKQRKRVAA